MSTSKPGGSARAGAVLYQFDEGSDPAAPSTYLGLSSEAPEALRLVREVGEYSEQRRRLKQGGLLVDRMRRSDGSDPDEDGDGAPDFQDPDDTDGPIADADGDRLTNAEEAVLGTDPFNPDTDGGGVYFLGGIGTDTGDAEAYAMLGHGGYESDGNHFGNITVNATAGGDGAAAETAAGGVAEQRRRGLVGRRRGVLARRLVVGGELRGRGQ